jgi:CubicO group peptidase (beta-lactamase class C family)
MIKSIVSVFFLFLTIYTSQGWAQSRQQFKTDSVFKLVKQYVNHKQADSLYTLTGKKFRDELSINDFRSVCELQIFPLDAIKQTSLMSFVNNKLATYKIEFPAVTLELLLTLDEQDKIELFVFQPYKIPRADKASVLSSNKMISDIDKKVDSAARPYILKANTVGLSIGILRYDVIKSYNYGETVRGNHKLPNENSIYEIGSITKTFTATLLAWYANAGKLKLNDPITKYLPDSVRANGALRNITLVMLSNHTSGLPRLPDNMQTRAVDPQNPYKYYSKEQLYGYLKSCKISSTPGEKYAYSNLGAGLLGTILEQVSGKSFEDMVKDIICSPLEMYSTGQHIESLFNSHLVTEYNDDGEQTPMWEFDALAAAGCLRSSVVDLLSFARVNMYPGITPLAKAVAVTQKITFSKDVTIALGWHIIKVNNTDYYFHNGGTYGSSSFLAWNTAKNLAVVVLSNCGESVDEVGLAILKKL